jgi:quinol-cytochrome oxidoreductase complex cytochrome b subunit
MPEELKIPGVETKSSDQTRPVPSSICPDPSWPFGEPTEECDLFDAMPLRERYRAGLPLVTGQIDYLGKAVWVTFVIVVISGIGLLAGYRPTIEGSMQSVEYIQNHMTGGWWLRGIHKIGTDLLVILTALRLIRIAWRRAYRNSGKLNWISAIVTFLFVAVSGMTGILLVWTGGVESPARWVEFFTGRGELSQSALSAVFSIHIALTMLFLLFSLRWKVAARRQAPRHKAFEPWLPVRLVFAILAALSVLALFFPPAFGEPMDRALTLPGQLTWWYLLAPIGAAGGMSGIGAMVLILVFIALVCLLPWLDGSARPGPCPIMNAIIVAWALDWVILTICGAIGLHSWVLAVLVPIVLFILCVGLGIWAEAGLNARELRKTGEVGIR